jgi:hypothetical protein
MTLTQGLQPSAILSRPVPEPWRRPSQGAARGRVVRTEERVDRGFGGVGEEAMAIDPEQELVGRDASAATRLAIRPAAIARKTFGDAFCRAPLIVFG